MNEKQEKELTKWLEESVLSYAQRKKLPAKSFCGPNNSYPAHDRKHAANCLARAAQQLKKGKLSRSQYNKITACCRRKLKSFGGKPSKVSETAEWFLEKEDMEWKLYG